MPVTMIVGYPRGSNVNVDYYLNQHIPMVVSVWNDPNLKWTAMTATSDSDPYEASFLVAFESKEALDQVTAAFGNDGHQKMRDDIKNFSGKEPEIWVMEHKAGSLGQH